MFAQGNHMQLISSYITPNIAKSTSRYFLVTELTVCSHWCYTDSSQQTNRSRAILCRSHFLLMTGAAEQLQQHLINLETDTQAFLQTTISCATSLTHNTNMALYSTGTPFQKLPTDFCYQLESFEAFSIRLFLILPFQVQFLRYLCFFLCFLFIELVFYFSLSSLCVSV